MIKKILNDAKTGIFEKQGQSLNQITFWAEIMCQFFFIELVNIQSLKPVFCITIIHQLLQINKLRDCSCN